MYLYIYILWLYIYIYIQKKHVYIYICIHKVPISLEAMSFVVQDMTINSTDPRWSSRWESCLIHNCLKIRDLESTDTHIYIQYIQINIINLIDMQVLYMYFLHIHIQWKFFLVAKKRWRPWSRWRRQASCLPAPRSGPFRLNRPGVSNSSVGLILGAAVKKCDPLLWKGRFCEWKQKHQQIAAKWITVVGWSV